MSIIWNQGQENCLSQAALLKAQNVTIPTCLRESTEVAYKKAPGDTRGFFELRKNVED
jgi:hypothetical protein